MQNHLQPLFNINLSGQDVTRDVDFGVTYDERADQVTTLTFVLKRGAYYLEVVKPGQKVVLTGGTLDKSRKIFSGTVKKLKSIFNDSGEVTVQIEAYDTIWGGATNNRRVLCYPQKGSTRTWADRPTLKSSEIIENLANEMSAQLNLVLPNGADAVYTLIRPLVQNKMTDWSLLRTLAKRLGCFVWTDVQGPTLVLNFVDASKVTNYSSKISFLYPQRDENEFVVKVQKPNQLLLRSVTVDEDVQAADANLRIVTKFDDKSGEEISLISKTMEKDGKRYIYYYQLDEAKVAALERDNPKEADRLRQMGIFDIPPEDFLKYYKTVEFVEDTVAVWSQIFIGITVNATSDGNVDIHSQQSYELSGIARYSTNEKLGRYYLRSLKYIWDDQGFTNEYEFMK